MAHQGRFHFPPLPLKHPEAAAAQSPEDVHRIEKEMQRPDTEQVRKQIAFLKLYDPGFDPDILPFPQSNDSKRA